MALVFASTGSSPADDYPRDDDIDMLHYAFELTLSDESDLIRGRTTVRVKFEAADVQTITLDLIDKAMDADTGMTAFRVRRGKEPVAFVHENDHLILRVGESVVAGDEREYVIEYEGIPADGLVISKSRHGDRTFFGDNFPNRTRKWLPTLDHPHDKATCEFIVTAPDHYRVIGTGTRQEEVELEGGLRRTHLRQDTALSTYLMVIGVARFAVQDLEPHRGIPISTWVYTQDREDGFHDFALAGAPFDFFVDYIGPYPWSKLANVQSTTRWGGMENAGNIFYDEKVVNGRRSIDTLLAHEIAHQWFGDSVTVDDWHHVWLSEGFATYFTHLYVEHSRGREMMVRGLVRDRNRVIGYARQNPDQPIVDPRIPVERILSANVYQKAGWVLHMLRREIGDEQFHNATSEFHLQYRHDNAVTEDFQHIVETIAGRKLDGFFKQWFYTPGVPELEGEWDYDAEKQRVVITLRQSRDDGTLYDIPLDIGVVLEEGGEAMIETVRVNQAHNGYAFASPHEPVEVTLDPNTWLLMDAEFDRN